MKRWLTVHDVCQEIGCSRRMVYRAVATGRLQAAAVNERGDFRFLMEWVDEWMLRSRTTLVAPKEAA